MRFPAIVLLCLFVNGVLPAAESHPTNTVAEADLRKLKLAPGLKAEVFAAEPLLENPVCFSIDARGRFFVVETHRYRNSIFDITANTPWLLDDLSFRTVNDRAAFLSRTFVTNFAVLTNESERIRLVEDRDGDGRAETTSVFADGFRESISGTAAGILAQGTNVWFTSIPDLWKFGSGVVRESVISKSVVSDQSGARRLASRTVAGRQLNTDSLITDLLATGLGVHISVSGHDVHGLIRGHDGRIYFSFGDRGVCVTNREGMVLNVPDTGGVLRCEPDGRNLEIFCTGLRNPQELAFDDLGNLWTVDNDTAGADPCRVLHLVEGGDYGWRMSYQHMKGFGPWVSEEMWRGGLDGILPPAGIVSQGPAGLAFYPGTSLAPQLAGRFVHADFPGGVWAYSVKPRGASYELADKEKILWNCWPTDVDFGPDGALYVLDWVQGWSPPGKGRIYRLTGNAELGARNAEQVAEVKRLLGEGMGKRGEKELLGLLGHADRRVRLEAQWELAGRGTNSFAGLAQAAKVGGNRFARIHALWAIRPIVRSLPVSEGAAELFSLMDLLKDEDAEIRGQAAQVLGEGRLFNSERPIAELLQDNSIRVRYQAIQASVERWRDDFIVGGRRKPSRTYFSSYQTIAGQVAEPVGKVVERLTRALGQPSIDVVDAIGATVTGKLPSQASSQLLSVQAMEPFIVHAVVQFNFNTTKKTGAFDSWFMKSSNVNSRAAAALTHRRTGSPAVTNLLKDDAAVVVLQSARAINDAPIPAAYPALAALLEDPRFRDANWGRAALSNLTPAGPFSATVRPPRDQVLLRALNANFRVGGLKNAEALVRFATGAPVSDPARSKVLSEQHAGSETGAPMPATLRAEALFLLGAWEVLPATVGDLSIKPTKDPNHGAVPTVNPENWPGWFDRVMGAYRPLPPRPADAARRALAPHITALLASQEPEIAKAAIDAAVKLRLTNASPTLLALMRSATTAASLRKQIPGALASLDAAELGDAVKLALTDGDAAIRAAALPHLGRLRSDDAVRILGGIITTAIGAPVSDPARSLKEGKPSRAGGRRSEDDTWLAQAAFAALGKLNAPGADAILRSALTNLIAGKIPATLELDLTEAAARWSDPQIKSLLAQHDASRPKDDVLGGWRSALAGGDAERGRTIFTEKVEVQCLRCHVVKGQGGIVGPKLDGIGAQRSREYLLESMVFPNRAIASGFENVTLVLKNGAEHAGLVKGEDDKELRLESPEEGALRIAKADIVTRQRGLSAMPEGMDQLLTQREVRDLVEYLAGLK